MAALHTALATFRSCTMTRPANLKHRIEREVALLLLLLFTGLVLLPLSVYLVGNAVFGEYAGAGFADFYATLHQKLRQGEAGVWFLVLSPCLGWQTLRLTFHLFRRAAPRPAKTADRSGPVRREPHL